MEYPVFNYILFFVGGLLTLCSLFIAGLNYSAFYINHRDKKRGVSKHSSQIYLLPQILLIFAYMLFQHSPVYPVSGWLLLGIALVDPSIWMLAALPVMLWLRK